MSHLRDDILEWAENGHLQPKDVPSALQLSGLTPTLSGWRSFLRALLLWTGVILIGSGVIFFFAYNWNGLHRFAKFGLAEALFGAALLAAWYIGVERPAGKAALLGAAMLTGALLALVGQTYQTGADPFELFAIWAALIFPCVLAARFAPLWIMWIALLNVSVVMYFQARDWGLLGLLLGTGGMLWAALALNVTALAAWEFGLAHAIPWLTRWGARILALLTGTFATSLGILSIFESREVGSWAIVAYIIWLVATCVYYQARVFDVFMLAGAALSAIVIVTSFLVKHVIRHGDAGGFLITGLLVIALSAGAAYWIRHLLLEEQAT